MASTYTLTRNGKAEHMGREKVTRWDLDVTSYDSTTDIGLTAAELGLKTVSDIEAQAEETRDLEIRWTGDTATIVLTATVLSTGVEAANATDLGVIRLVAYGR